MATWSPDHFTGAGAELRYGAVRTGFPAEARYVTCTPGSDGIAEGRRAEFVAKTTTRTSGSSPSSEYDRRYSPVE